MTEAAERAGISIGEAILHAKAEDAGEYSDIDTRTPTMGHNSGGQAMPDVIQSDQLRLLIERVERLEEEKSGIAADIKDVYAEAKAVGYDPKIMREIVRERRTEKHVRDEREALLDTYRAALGMLDGTPLGNAALRAVG